jgi:hypothetical protein
MLSLLSLKQRVKSFQSGVNGFSYALTGMYTPRLNLYIEDGELY